MKYTGAAIVVFCCYLMGGFRTKVRERAVELLKLLSKSLNHFALSIEVRGLSVLAAVEELADKKEYDAIEFYAQALRDADAGVPLGSALSDRCAAWMNKIGVTNEPIASEVLAEIGRCDVSEESGALKTAAAYVDRSAASKREEIAKLNSFYKVVYALAGAAAAVMVM